MKRVIIFSSTSGFGILYTMLLAFVLFQSYKDVKEMLYFSHAMSVWARSTAGVRVGSAAGVEVRRPPALLSEPATRRGPAQTLTAGSPAAPVPPHPAGRGRSRLDPASR